MKLSLIINVSIFLIGFASCTKNTLKDIELSDSPFAENSGIDLFVIDSGNIEGTGIFAIGHIYYRINLY